MHDDMSKYTVAEWKKDKLLKVAFGIEKKFD